MVWPHLKILGHGEDSSAGDSERSKKERKTEEQIKVQEGEEDRRTDGKITSGNGREWGLEIP